MACRTPTRWAPYTSGTIAASAARAGSWVAHRRSPAPGDARGGRAALAQRLGAEATVPRELRHREALRWRRPRGRTGRAVRRERARAARARAPGLSQPPPARAVLCRDRARLRGREALRADRRHRRAHDRPWRVVLSGLDRCPVHAVRADRLLDRPRRAQVARESHSASGCPYLSEHQRPHTNSASDRRIMFW